MSTGTTLVLLGVACIIAAIVGGGFKLARTEFPTITSVRRQLLLALFGVILILGRWAMDRPSGPGHERDVAVDPGPEQEQAVPTARPAGPRETPTRRAPADQSASPEESPAIVAVAPGVETRVPAPAVEAPRASCEPRVLDQPGFTLVLLASGGYRLTAPSGQCPTAGIGETLVIEIEFCSGRPSSASTLVPDFQAYDRNGSRIRSQAELGVATAGPDRRYGYETLSGRQNPRFATGAAYAKLAIHGRGQLRDVAPQLCAIEIR